MADEMICCFTGHRHIEDKMFICMQDVLRTLIKELSVRGVKTFRAGGAIGFDNYAALNVLLLKTWVEGVKLDLILPCRDQDAKWRDEDKQLYRRLIKEADTYTYVQEEYTKDCFHKRNRMLVDGADFCIAYYDGSPSGTGYTVNYAKKRGVYVINIYPMVLEERIRRYGEM